jgi:hypothetical protein
MFVDPSKDWLTHMHQLLPIENPRGVAGLAKQMFADSYREFDSDPTDPECPHRQRSTYCHPIHHADDSRLLVPPAYISADIPLAKRKPSPQCAWLLPQVSAIPSTASLTHSVAYTQHRLYTASLTHSLRTRPLPQPTASSLVVESFVLTHSASANGVGLE